MLKQWQFALLTFIAALAVVLALINMAMFAQNRDAQMQVAGRSQFIQQSGQLQNLYKELVNGLADLAVRNQDQALRDLLTAQGITLNAPPQGAPPASGAADANGGKR
jgi:ABC-type transport system involved in cytochrome bd biosynthesis fused ATPase/permease subunit